jgi:hypothetical protein
MYKQAHNKEQVRNDKNNINTSLQLALVIIASIFAFSSGI